MTTDPTTVKVMLEGGLIKDMENIPDNMQIEVIDFDVNEGDGDICKIRTCEYAKDDHAHIIWTRLDVTDSPQLPVKKHSLLSDIAIRLCGACMAAVGLMMILSQSEVSHLAGFITALIGGVLIAEGDDL